MPKPPKILALSSGGGHWVQLLRLRPAFAGCQVVYATVKGGYRGDVDGARFHVIPDSNRWDKLALARSAWAIFKVLRRERPDVVISTGAAPGYFAILLGGWLGARTVWVDSVANAEELSLSGRRAGACADLWLTQWPHLADEVGERLRCFGSVL
jgi:UDP-N-acetylglucosamine:LPS N-acetylglucosamine transferase